jgi:hypothetical protein
VTTSASTAHADVSRLAGLDYINRALGPDNFHPGQTVLVDSLNPLDDWRSLSFLNEWTVDGIVMSADSPGYVLGASRGARNDQLFNIGIQGPVQLNNGYMDDSGHGVAAHYDRQRQLAAGNLALKHPPGMSRSEYIQQGGDANSMIQSLIAGPFYQQYPLQMFDRNIKPLTDLYIGLICRRIDGAELAAIDAKTGGRFAGANHIHVFQYVCFSSRQVYQFAVDGDDPDNDPPDFDVTDTGRAGRRNTNPDPNGSGFRRGVDDYNVGESEPADRRRGPNDPKRGRTDNYLPRKRAGEPDDEYATHDNFLGLKKSELKNMVGAWRIGKVLDVASKRLDSYIGGPIDTAFSVTLNFSLDFIDWRQLRRNFTMNIFGYDLDIEDGTGSGDQIHWRNYDPVAEKFAGDFGRVMQWPTWYDLDNPAKNVPIDPKMKETGNNYTTRFEWDGGKVPALQIKEYLDTMKELKDAGPGNETTMGFVQEVGESAAGALGGVAVPPTAARARACASVSATAAQPAAQPATQPAAQPPAPAPVQAPVQPSAGPLSFPEQVEQPRPAARSSGKAKAPTAASVDPVGQPAAPKAASKAASGKATKPAPSKASAIGAIGDDVMASIFGSSMPAGATADASADQSRAPERGDADSRTPAQPKSFPRRRDR